MYQHQPRVGFDTKELDPFVFDPMRSVKCEWEITDGKHIAVGECKSLLRNYAKCMRGVMGGGATPGVEVLKDIGGTDRNVGFQSQQSYYNAWHYNNDSQGALYRRPGIHVGSGGAAVLHTDNALAAELANNISNPGQLETTTTVTAIPINNSTEYQFTMSATFTPAANGTVNEIGLSTRMAHTVLSSALGGLSGWLATGGRFMMVRDNVAGFALTAGVPYTVKFTFRFLPTATSYFTMSGASLFGRMLSDQFASPTVLSWDKGSSIPAADMLPRANNTERAFIGVGDDLTAFSMNDYTVTNGVRLLGNPVITEELLDTARCRWNATQSHTFVANKTIRSACLALLTSTYYCPTLCIAKLASPVSVLAGGSQAFKFTFEIAV